MSSKRSKVNPKYKTKYRVKNWAAYDRSLVARGDLTLWITPDAFDAWHPTPTGRRGAQPKFSDLAIETALMLRLVFCIGPGHLTVRRGPFIGPLRRRMHGLPGSHGSGSRRFLLRSISEGAGLPGLLEATERNAPSPEHIQKARGRAPAA